MERVAEGAGAVGWNLANNSIVQLITLGLPDEGVHEIYAPGIPSSPGPPCRGRAGGAGRGWLPRQRALALRQRLSGECLAIGSFQILDGGQPRRNPDGTAAYWRWRRRLPRADAQVVAGSWDVTGLRGTGSFDWTVEDVFLPERRTMVQAGTPLDNQWQRWPGVPYALPAQAWVGPHHSAVITGIARAGLDALSSWPARRRHEAGPGCSVSNPRSRTPWGGPMRCCTPDAAAAR